MLWGGGGGGLLILTGYCDVYSAFAVIFNILRLEVAYDSMRLFYWHLHYICDLVYVNVLYCVLFYWYLLCSRKQISMLFIDNKISVFCILTVQ